MHRVSVALATYNGAKFLSEQLASLEAQTHKPHELVVSDDGSSDNTLEVVAHFATQCSFPVRILHSDQRLQFRRNFRRAAEACSGELIAFCDQDDIWHPEKLAILSRLFSDPEVMLAYHNATVFDHESRRPLLSASEETSDLARRPPPAFKTVNGLLQIFRSELLRYGDLWDLSIDEHDGRDIMAHDKWFLFLALAMHGVRFVDKPLADYRQHGSNTIGVKVSRKLADRLAERLVHFGEQDLKAAASARQRAEILQRVDGSTRLTGSYQVIEGYRKLSNRLNMRAAAYEPTSLLSRLASVSKLMLMNGYNGGSWAFSPLSLLRDLWSGVVKSQWREE